MERIKQMKFRERQNKQKKEKKSNYESIQK